MIRIFIGYDPREPVAYHVCADSILRNASEPVAITPLYLPHLAGYRETHTDGSNEFIYSRFLIPALCDYQGWALYLDGDMVVRGDVAELWGLRDYSKAVMVVKHPPYQTKAPKKYLGNRNEDYPRKNWSSVMLFNCAHFHTRRLERAYVENANGSQLHQFQWTEDERIGELPSEWNWLVGESPENPQAKLLHYTLGIPAFPEYQKCDHAADWFRAYEQMTHCETTNPKGVENGRKIAPQTSG